MSNIESFEQLINNFDLTYNYSDDAKVYRRGKEQGEAITLAAKSLPADEVRKAYNAMVDRKIAEPYRHSFYWGAA